jgi:predicted nucleic acid-binding protein
MISTPETECSAVLDACVLVPAALCDTLLRLAEEPAMYRPFWSEQIMDEMTKALQTKIHRSEKEAEYRRRKMNEAFPGAMVRIPPRLIRAVQCIPDPDDRHVLAAAVMARANTIVTQNTKHFPKDCLEEYGVVCLTADEFLVQQYQLNPQLVLDKVDDQAIGISKDRAFVVSSLRGTVREFCKLLEQHAR